MGFEEAINKIYNDGKKIVDDKGYSKKFKQAAESFQLKIKKELNITFENVEYLDGYFIFGMGTNSVFHFNLKETPGWKYGVWWSIPEDVIMDGKAIKPEYIEGAFFAQYEEIIDKFKPSASTITEKFTILPNDDSTGYSSLYGISNQIKFIRNEPYLAFCRDYCYWNYNEEYHSRRDAKRIFKMWIKNNKYEEKYTKIFNNKFISLIKNSFKKEIEADEIMIIDEGENCSPRYEILAKASAFQNLDPTCHYILFDTEEDKDTLKKWNRINKKIERLSDKHDFYYFTPFDNYFTVISDDSWNKFKKLSIIEQS